MLDIELPIVVQLHRRLAENPVNPVVGKEENNNWSSVPSNSSDGLALRRFTTPPVTMAGCLEIEEEPMFLLFPLWSYQVVINPLELPTKASRAVWSKSPEAVKPMSWVASSLLRRTRKANPA